MRRVKCGIPLPRAVVAALGSTRKSVYRIEDGWQICGLQDGCRWRGNHWKIRWPTEGLREGVGSSREGGGLESHCLTPLGQRQLGIRVS
jgi:hypothetical protein